MQVFEHPPSCSEQVVLVLLAFAWEIAPSRSLSSSSLHRPPPHTWWPTCWLPRLCNAGTCSRCSCTFQNRIKKVRLQMFKLILRERKLTGLASDGETRTKVEVGARWERYLSPWLPWQRPRWNRLSRNTTKEKNEPGYWYFARNWSSHCPSSTKQNMAPCKKTNILFFFYHTCKDNSWTAETCFAPGLGFILYCWMDSACEYDKRNVAICW